MFNALLEGESREEVKRTVEKALEFDGTESGEDETVYRKEGEFLARVRWENDYVHLKIEDIDYERANNLSFAFGLVDDLPRDREVSVPSRPEDQSQNKFLYSSSRSSQESR